MSITELASSEILTELCNNLDNINFLSKINNISNLNEEFWLSFIYLKDFKKLGGDLLLFVAVYFVYVMTSLKLLLLINWKKISFFSFSAKNTRLG